MIKKREFRKKEIEDKLKDILDSINIIEEAFPQDFDSFESLGLSKDGIYKKIEFAIESIIDICNIINSDLRLGTPETEDDIINNLDKRKVLTKETINLIKEMKGFRNILVHRYGEINDKKAFDTIKEGLKDFELIIKEIEDFLKRRN